MDRKTFLEFNDENGKLERAIRINAIETIEIDEKDKTLIRIYTHKQIFVHKMANEQLAEAELICLLERIEQYFSIF